jgi:hypothetical protein
MSGVFWFLVGGFVGIDVGLAYCWLSLRRVNRRPW